MSGLQVNMTKGSILKSLLVFSLPILMSNLFQQLYNTMDILIVGNYLGDSSLAAIGASSSIYELLIGFCFGVGSGLFYILRHAAVLVPERRHFAAGKHLYGELLSQGVFTYIDSCTHVTPYGTSSDWLEETFGEINEKYVIEDQPDLFLGADLMEA